MAKQLLFSFADMTSRDKPVRELTRMFKRAGIDVAQIEVDPTIRRTSGVSYRQVFLTFVDNQQVAINIKQTGDIYQVLVNKKPLPLRNPDDHIKAVAEVVKALDSGRAAYQRKLAAAKVQLPPSVRTAAPRKRQLLVEKRDALLEAIEATKQEVAKFLLGGGQPA